MSINFETLDWDEEEIRMLDVCESDRISRHIKSMSHDC